MDKNILIYTQPYSGTWFLTNLLKQTTKDLQIDKNGENRYYENPPEIYTDSWFHTYRGSPIKKIDRLNNYIKVQKFSEPQMFSIHYGRKPLYQNILNPKKMKNFKIAYTIKHPLLMIISMVSRSDISFKAYFQNSQNRKKTTKRIIEAQTDLMNLPKQYAFGLLLDRRFRNNLEYRILRVKKMLKFFNIKETEEGQWLLKVNRQINTINKFLKMSNRSYLQEEEYCKYNELKKLIYNNIQEAEKVFNIETELLQNHYKRIKQWEKKMYRPLKIVFDLDNVIAMHYPDIKDYPINSKPNEAVIKKINKLHKQGIEIILYTARKMQTSGHNVGKAIAKAGKKTFEWLEKYNVPYDAIFFGKPNGDIYLDDKAMNFDYLSLESKLDSLGEEL